MRPALHRVSAVVIALAFLSGTLGAAFASGGCAAFELLATAAESRHCVDERFHTAVSRINACSLELDEHVAKITDSERGVLRHVNEEAELLRGVLELRSVATGVRQSLEQHGRLFNRCIRVDHRFCPPASDIPKCLHGAPGKTEGDYPIPEACTDGRYRRVERLHGSGAAGHVSIEAPQRHPALRDGRGEVLAIEVESDD